MMIPGRVFGTVRSAGPFGLTVVIEKRHLVAARTPWLIN
jgi:hypothetical protein